MRVDGNDVSSMGLPQGFFRHWPANLGRKGNEIDRPQAQKKRCIFDTIIVR
jgi:hypothetical protein